MSVYRFEKAESELFAVFHAVYSEDDLYSYDWNDRLSDLRICNHCYFLLMGEVKIGGFTFFSEAVCNPFLITPFEDRKMFWEIVLEHLMKENQIEKINITYVHQKDVDTLIEIGADFKWSQQSMSRPTEKMSVHTDVQHHLCPLEEKDMDEIVQLVYQAHLNGMTAKAYGKPNIFDVKNAIQRRFDLFSQTNTLNFGVITKEKQSGNIIGVCMAGIYPTSPNYFATIHQVSVLPQYRRQGIAEAMMTYAIDKAHAVSPVIGLTVLVGNPAQKLYRKLGFTEKPSYSDFSYTVKTGINS